MCCCRRDGRPVLLGRRRRQQDVVVARLDWRKVRLHLQPGLGVLWRVDRRHPDVDPLRTHVHRQPAQGAQRRELVRDMVHVLHQLLPVGAPEDHRVHQPQRVHHVCRQGNELLRVSGACGQAARHERAAPNHRQHRRRHAHLPRQGRHRSHVRRVRLFHGRTGLLQQPGRPPQNVPLVAAVARAHLHPHWLLHRRGLSVGLRARHRHHLPVLLRRLRHPRRRARAGAADPARRDGCG
mmetsp:Transcript_14892/g.32858  ORF Transcript_14892/g.32858 Transcript_14892/m.32858 type:complete len:237 (+) Transcript_14892:420-1130(+)